jgi:hypothetical protein
MDRTDLLHRGQDFANRKGLTLGDRLGAGVHGIVFNAKSKIDEGRLAIKVHERKADYCRERDVYLRLSELGITNIRDCHVPELIAYDDELLVIEMTVVTRPFVLDFAGAFLDQPPDFSEEVLADWRAEKLEQFEARWPLVQTILGVLEGYGVFMVDVNPGNISFSE